MTVLAGLALFASPACTTQQAPVAASALSPLVEQSERALAPGAEYKQYRLGSGTRALQWFLSFGVARNTQERLEAERCAARFGLAPRVKTFVFPGSASQRYEEIIAGDFSTRKASQSVIDSHKADDACKPVVRASGQYPGDQTAPFLVHVLEIDPAKFKGRLVAMRENGMASGRVAPSKLLAQAKGLAATNGGYFVMKEQDGVVGESAGISVLSGIMQSEPTKGRPWVSIENGARLTVRFHRDEGGEIPALVNSNGHRILLDGINRRPGELRNCGALRDSQFRVPWHDRTCAPANEMIVLTPAAGFEIKPTKDELAYRLTPSGDLVQWTGGSPGPDDLILVARGERRSELEALAASKSSWHLDLGDFGRKRPVFAVNGGPMLIEGGEKVARDDSEGWPFFEGTREQADEMHGFVTVRHPRTALGVTKDGKVLLMVVDGRAYRADNASKAGMNGGASLPELADILLRFGAYQAINLDGGGSSAMVLADGVVSHPSDSAGERPVGDSMVLLPAPTR